MPLDPARSRAAGLIAAGHTYVETAAELGVHKATVTRWAQTAAFKDAVARVRGARSGEQSEPRAVVESCLSATDKDGHPNWGVRLRAAEKLIDLDGHEPDNADHADGYELPPGLRYAD